MINDFPTYCPQQFRPNIDSASNTVDIDLNHPIDVSQMEVHKCSVLPIETYVGMRFERKTELRTRDNEGDAIIITITRISQKRPGSKASTE